MEKQIKEEFVQNGFSIEDEEEVLKKCTAFCINYGLKPSDLLASWELYYLNMQLDGCKVQNSQMDGFLHYVQNEQKESLRKQEPDFHFYSSNDLNLILENEQDHDDDEIHKTPEKPYDVSAKPNTGELISAVVGKTPAKDGSHSSQKQKPKNSTLSSPSTPFSNRSKKYDVQFVFNEQMGGSPDKGRVDTEMEDGFMKRLPEHTGCSLEILGKPPQRGFRYMNANIEEKFLSLEKKITNFANSLSATESRSVYRHVALASQESVIVVGLICCDGEGRLNDQSVLLEGSAEYSGGQRVKLDLQKVDNFSVFPGQVIGVEGYNLSGHCLVASRVIDSYPVLKSLNTEEEKTHAKKRMALDGEFLTAGLESKSTTMNMLVVAGPFTTTDNLEFQPLDDLLLYCRKKNINLLILMGPFVDTHHPEVKDGTVDRLYRDIFLQDVCSRLQGYCEDMGPSARVLLVPSVRDAHHDFVFPQPAFDLNGLENHNQQINCVANPGIFLLNKVMFGVCTVDILKHLSSEEISRTSGHGSRDRLAKLATHVLKQRSFYPLFPAASGLPLDLCAAPEALDIPVLPDILILPSDLAPFVKVLQVGGTLTPTGSNTEEGISPTKCICINPGRLAKGTLGGSFAEVLIQEKHGNSTQKNLSTSIDEITTISIVRI